LKPANIMLRDASLVKIMDFGLARRQTPPSPVGATIDWRPSGSRGISGTPNYMAPEQVRGSPPTLATDVFAVGLILYEMVAGRPAVTGTHLLEVLRRIEQIEAERYAAETPAPFAAILAQALIADERQRTITMTQIAGLLNSHPAE
jgi:serine/threonine-protein kinase